MNWNDGSTSCAKAREAIADAVIARRPADDHEVERHLITCADCRSYRAECESMWTKLGELPTPVPSPDARAKFDAAVRRESPAPIALPRARPAWRIAAIAAGLIVAALIGYGAATTRSRSGESSRVATATPDSTSQYLLLLYDTRETERFVSTPAQLSAVVAEYSAWARELSSAGQLVSAEKLSDGPAEWLGGSVATAGDERIGGFFLIRAHDAAEARRIAARCPHLKYGGRIELRPIQTT